MICHRIKSLLASARKTLARTMLVLWLGLAILVGVSYVRPEGFSTAGSDSSPGAGIQAVWTLACQRIEGTWFVVRVGSPVETATAYFLLDGMVSSPNSAAGEYDEDWWVFTCSSRCVAYTASSDWPIRSELTLRKHLSVPLEPPLIALTIWMASRLVPYIRHRRRKLAGHCATCGYNLTGNVSGRCPECGQAFSFAPPAAAIEDARPGG